MGPGLASVSPADNFWGDFFCVERVLCPQACVACTLWIEASPPSSRVSKAQPSSPTPAASCSVWGWELMLKSVLPAAKEPEFQKGEVQQEAGEACPTWDLVLHLLSPGALDLEPTQPPNGCILPCASSSLQGPVTHR